MDPKVLYVMDEGIGNMVFAFPVIDLLDNTDYDVSVVGKYPALDLLPPHIKAYTIDELEDVDAFDVVLLSCWSQSYKDRYGVKGHKGNPEVFESDPIDGNEYEFMLHYDLAACLEGIEKPENFSEIYLPTPMLSPINTPKKPYVVLANCAAPTWDHKRWKHFSQLSHLLADKYKVVIVGGDHDKDYFIPEDYHKDVEYYFDLPLPEVSYLLQYADYVIANDCGIGHIASILDVPTIMIFGPTSKNKNMPLGYLVNEVLDKKTNIAFPLMACSACQFTDWESICTDNQCMSVVQPELIADYVLGNVLNPSSLYRITLPEQKQELTIVMRVKDAISTIHECLESAKQICDYFVIVDNGSTDGTLEYLQSFVKKNPDMFWECPTELLEGIEGVVPSERDDGIHTIVQTVGYDEIRDRQVMDIYLKNVGSTWAMLLDSDEIVDKQLTREYIEVKMSSHYYNIVKFRHVHFWNDKKHYRTDQRWKPKHNRMMWRITPESTITTDKRIHPDVVRNVKGKTYYSDHCILHYGHIDKEVNKKRVEFYKSIDNPNTLDWSGRTYQHMIDETGIKLVEWNDDILVKDRDFGNPSILIVCLHGGGDMLMLTPTLEKLKKVRPDLEISILGLGKTKDGDFKSHQYFENNPNVYQYYDSEIDYHPIYWNNEQFYSVDLPIIQKNIDRLQETHCTRFDEVIIITLQSDYEKHRIDRFAIACNTSLDDDEKEMQVYPLDEDWEWAVDVVEEYVSDTPKETISVHRYCGNPEKSWDYQEYKNLVDFLSQDKDKVLVLWDQGDPEPIIEGDNIINMSKYADDLTISRSYELIQLCCLHIGPDSLPMHLASAANILVISIFEKTRPSNAAPLNPDSVIATNYEMIHVSDIDFRIKHQNRIVRTGSGKVKAECIYPILHKMGELDLIEQIDYEIPTSRCQINNVDIVYPTQDKSVYDPVMFKVNKVHQELKHYLKHCESVFLDVGANAGIHSVLLHNSIYKGIAIEPSSSVYQMLEQNISEVNKNMDYPHLVLSGEVLIDTYHCGVSDKSGKGKLNWTPKGTMVSFTSEQGEFLANDVDIKTIDALCDEWKPDIVKMNIEGGELKALQGAVETLKSVRAINVELHGYDDQEVLQFLSDKGFQIRFITRDNVIGVAQNAHLRRFPTNCLYDISEHLTMQINSPVLLESQIYPDQRNWFEHIGESYIPTNVEYCRYHNQLGYKESMKQVIWSIQNELKTDFVYLNFLFSEEGKSIRYKGDIVYPLNYETLFEFLAKVYDVGYSLEGQTDWYNVDLDDFKNYPDEKTFITRGRMLLRKKSGIPF